MKKVVKFGGSSLASARQFKKVKAIITADKTRCYVVPSAPGKRDGKDVKVTDLLYQCYDAAASGQSYKRILEQIKKRFTDIVDGLGLDLNLDFEFNRIEENFLNKAGRDYALPLSSRQSFPAFTVPIPTAPSAPFPAAVPILQAPLWPEPSLRICMKTGLTFPVFS